MQHERVHRHAEVALAEGIATWPPSDPKVVRGDRGVIHQDSVELGGRVTAEPIRERALLGLDTRQECRGARACRTLPARAGAVLREVAGALRRTAAAGLRERERERERSQESKALAHLHPSIAERFANARESATKRRLAFSAVLFDLGGVVLGSPLEAFAAYELELGLPAQALNKAIVAAGSASAWARLERGELTMPQFFEAFDAELTAAVQVRISAETLMTRIADYTQLRPAMLAAIRTIRSAGLKVAALTNNWASDDQFHKMDALRSEFDVFIESTKVGLRKPDPRIYQLACKDLGVDPSEVVFLDDIGMNLKAARALGMTTIKVTDYREALKELGSLLQLALVGPLPA